MSPIGVLVNNIGSPNSPEPKDVKKFLSQFLMDEDVISIPWLFRFILVRGIIVPIRGVSSSEKYKKIWFTEGSPLMVHTRRFAAKLQAELGSKYHVELGMRYGEPSIGSALEKFKNAGISKVVFAPLYPQYAAATTSAAIKEFQRVIDLHGHSFQVQNLEPFYHQDFFQKFWVQQFQNEPNKSWDHVLFSFHGLPESQIKKTPGCLVTSDCCDKSDACSKNCYRAQCFQTAHKIASNIGLDKKQYTVSFQSRLGRAKWIQPYTEATLEYLAKNNKKNVLILSPAFVADCVETLEEIQIELREKFLAWGGVNLQQISCPNDDTEWVHGFAQHINNL